jgi:hypothetical protein
LAQVVSCSGHVTTALRFYAQAGRINENHVLMGFTADAMNKPSVLDCLY